MRESFDVNQYWLERGQAYFREDLPRDFHRLQEEFLLDILHKSRISMRNVLEIGCGFGRITRPLSKAFPNARIAALDLSPDLLEQARRFSSDCGNISFHQYDLYSNKPLPGADFDAVIAVEVFLHHRRPVVRSLLEKLSAVSNYIVNIDWSEDWPWQTPEHVWVHDYASIYSDAGLRCATFVLPKKIEGMQQKLFIASRHLDPSLIHLEQQTRNARERAESGPPVPPSLEVVQWPQQLATAIAELRRTLPVGKTLILVNDDQWGNESRALRDYTTLPFLEHDGLYWGPPADDRTALRELERLRRAGASYIVFAWSSFWWLDYYAEFHQYLRATCTNVLENERLIIFQLPPNPKASNGHAKTHA
jgi:SAM-dependent methyltransferase